MAGRPRDEQEEAEATRQLARGLAEADRSSKALKKALAEAAKSAEEEARARDEAIKGLKQTVAGIAGAGVSALGQRGAGADDLKAAVLGGFVEALPALGALLGTLVSGGNPVAGAIGAGAGKLAQAFGRQSQPLQEVEARERAVRDVSEFTRSRAEAGVPVSAEQSAQLAAVFFAREMRALENERQARENAQSLVLRLR